MKRSHWSLLLTVTVCVISVFVCIDSRARAQVVGTPSYVQSADLVDYFGTGNNTVVATFPSNVTSGNLVIAYVTWTSTNTLTGISDSCGNTYTLVPNTLVTGYGISAEGAYAQNVTGGSRCQVTATLSASDNTKTIAIHEISGILTSSALDGSVAKSTTGSAGSPISSGSFTTTANGDYLFGAVMSPSQNGQAITAGPGYSVHVSDTGHSVSLTSEDQIQSSAGSAAVSFNPAGFTSALVVGMAFKAGSGGVTPSPPTTYGITTSTSGTGVGSIACGGSACPSAVNAGSSLTFTATASTGSVFANWGGACSGSASTCTLTISANTSVSAVFNTQQPPTTPPPVVSGNFPWSPILDASRAIDWSGAGSSLIDQPRTQCGSTVAAYDGSAAAINNAIASCGGTAASPKYVELGAGTFNLTSGISFAGHSYVTLRGQGANSTFLVFTGAGGGFYNAVISLEPAQLVEWNDTFGEPNNCSWTAGYAKGATVLSLGSCRTGSASNLHVGSIVTLDQLDETADTGQVWNCLNSTVEGGPQCSNNGTGSGGYARNDGATIPCASCTGGVMKYRSQEQGVVVTAVNGNTVTVTPGLYMANWNSAQKPEATFGNTELVGAGLENLSLQAGMPNGIGGTNTSSAGQNIHIGQCRDCWVKGVRSLYANRSHIQVYIATHITIRDSYFYQNISHASVSYGVELNSAFDSLVENNIFQQSTDGEPNCNGACAGNVASYNFDIDNVWGSAGWMQAGFYAHSSGDAFNLWEGNVGPGYTSDDVHGTHHLETIFRNRIIGNQAAGCGSSGPATCSAQTVPLNLYAGSRYYNVIGNVLGQAGYHNVYSANCTTDDSCFNTVTAIYRLGQTGAGGASGFCTTPSCTGHGNYDPQVSAYLMRWGNWDTVHSTVQWNPSEVPASLPLYANAVPASQFLPPSFFRTSAPSWWPAGKPWPPIGPDISGGTMSGSAGHANTIPAEDCFTNVMNGPADGSGGFLNFDAGTCYGGGGGGGPTPTPTPAPTPDVTAPVVSITAPVNSSTISGTISLAANATDNIGVQTVQFQVDGINLGSVLTTPTSGSTYSGSWNTVGVSNGMHTITAVASDAAGNTATALSISVTVNNPIQTPTPTTPPSGGGSSGGGSSGGGGAGGGPINVPSIGIFTPAVPQKPLPATALKSAAASSRLLKSFQFPTTLKTYTTNVNAKNLQIFLNDHRFTVTQSGPGSIGNETTYYGPATIKALAKFQAANGIVPAIGNFGPITRAYVNLMIAAGK